jgi:nucleotide-binding universal stress UspA family protein
MSGAPTSFPPTVWDRVVCGIDGTASGLEAARQVARLMPGSAQLTLCAVVDPASIEGDGQREIALTREAEESLDQAVREIAASREAEPHLREGPPTPLLLDELISEQATLVAVGGHGHNRAAGAPLGSVATAIVHDAPCSVLIAYDTARVPSSGEVVVGFDGSGGARRALAVGLELTERMSERLRVITATGDAHFPDPGWSTDELEPGLAITEDSRTAVDALLDASVSAGLLILGSRHLPGATALSSVSQRVTRRANCSVLIVR